MTTAKEIEALFEGDATAANETRSGIATLIDRLAHFKSEAHALRQARKEVESSILVNTLFDGKNEKIREAQFALACSNTPAWKDADDALNGTQIDMESCERDIELRHRALRAKELQMQFRIEQMQYLNTPRFYKEIS